MSNGIDNSKLIVCMWMRLRIVLGCREAGWRRSKPTYGLEEVGGWWRSKLLASANGIALHSFPSLPSIFFLRKMMMRRILLNTKIII